MPTDTIIHFDCFAGAAGDMILGALINTGVPIKTIREELAKIPDLKGYTLGTREVSKMSLAGTKLNVKITGKQPVGRKYNEIVAMIQKSGLESSTRELACKIFKKLGKAEASVHNIALKDVHFHEIGAVDSIVDIVGTAIALNILGPDRITCSPIPVGNGLMKGDHGAMPIPSPATSMILTDIPINQTGLDMELTTPTGAAILSTISDGFGALPPMIVESIGWGAGTRDLPDRPNLLRVFMGEPVNSHLSRSDNKTKSQFNVNGFESDQVLSICASIDDMNPQDYESLMDRLFEAGALDVVLDSVQMKKGRPGTDVRVLAPLDCFEQISTAFFKHSTTIGLRHQILDRVKLPRKIEALKTKWGTVRIKYAGEQAIPEYDDLKKCAKKSGMSVNAIRTAVMHQLGTHRNKGVDS